MINGLDPERLAILRFYRDAGVITAEADVPGSLSKWPDSRRGQPPAGGEKPSISPPSAVARHPARQQPGASAANALAEAERAAARATTLEELVAAIAGFEGCALRESARGPVTHDGVLGADILVIGEAPGREEDRQGKPFVGRSGQLLDRMLAAIGLARAPGEGQSPVCISNVVYWRPPGNRNPTPAELAVCLPFARRFIALSRPRLVLTAGKVPTEAFFPEVSSIVRSRGQFRTLKTDDGFEAPVLPIFHPAFLLRQPAQKRWAWADLLAAKAKLNETLP